jgi:hypothetical protein
MAPQIRIRGQPYIMAREVGDYQIQESGGEERWHQFTSR